MMRQGHVLAAVLIVVAGCDGKPGGRDGKDVSGGGEPQIEYLPVPERIVVEVESGQVEAPFEVEDNTGASGGKCVVLAEEWITRREINPAFRTREGGRPVSKEGLAENPLGRALVPNGGVAVPFEVNKPGRYAFWVRAWFNSACGDSFYFALDEDPPLDSDGNGTYDERPPHTLDGSTHRRWKWFERKKVRFDLAEGPHVLRIYPREDGIRIDQAFFGEILEGVHPHVPQGMEAPATTAPVRAPRRVP